MILAYRPALTIKRAQHLLMQHYGLRGELSSLPGERDLNYLYRYPGGRHSVVKFANCREELSGLMQQADMLGRLATAKLSIDFPVVGKSLGGESLVVIIDDEGHQCYMRVVTFIQGTALAEFKPHSPALLNEIGAAIAAMDNVLATHIAVASATANDWDLRNAYTVICRHRQWLDGERGRLVDFFLASAMSELQPLADRLPLSLIHNDGNDYNIIVKASPSSIRQERVGYRIGIIDFGDALESWTIADLAVACAYIMLDKKDPITAAASVIAGYTGIRLLGDAEIRALYPLITLRLCLSVCMSAYQKQQQPDNEYLVISEAPVWRLLAFLESMNGRWPLWVFRHAGGLQPHPGSRTLQTWLKKNRSKFASITGQKWRPNKVRILDMSIESSMFQQLPKSASTAEFSELIFRRLQTDDADIAIGRYNEARRVYTGKQFEEASDNAPDWRTIHLGIDLFLPAGHPLHAPLDAVIHSFRDNAIRLDYGPCIILQHDADGLIFYTLYGHLSRQSLDGLAVGQPIRKGEEFARIGDFPANGDWPPHVHFQILLDTLGRKGEFPGVASAVNRPVWLSLCPDANLLLGIEHEILDVPEHSSEHLLRRRKKRLNPALSLAYGQPLNIVRGEGQYLYDRDGRKFLDLVNNVCHVGHCHPRVVQAASDQLAVLNTNTRYLHDHIVDYAQRLGETLPDGLDVCFFTNSGSEANDLAMRLACAHTGNSQWVVLDHAYHGNLDSLIKISPYKFDGQGGHGAPSSTLVLPLPDPYKGAYRGMDQRCGQRYAETARSRLDRWSGNQSLAALFAESISGCGGQVVYPRTYLATVMDACRSRGAVVILDEVQTGFGRIGDCFWAFEHYGVVPDIVTLGKPMGNGFPLAAVVTTREIAVSFKTGMEYFNTFAGNPVACAVGLAVLDVIEEQELQSHAHKMGRRLIAGLEALQQSFPLIGDVRGKGLFLGVELVLAGDPMQPATAEAAYISERLRQLGILISTDGPAANVLKIKPPMVLQARDVDRLLETLQGVLQESPLDCCR